MDTADDLALARRELAAVADDLVRAAADLLVATEEAGASAAELRRRSEEVGDLHDLLAGALAASDDVIVVVAVDDRRVRGWSGGATRRFGTPARDVVGRTLPSLRLPGLPAARLAEQVGRLGRHRDGDGPATATVPLPGGTFRLRPLPAPEGQPARAVVATLVEGDA